MMHQEQPEWNVDRQTDRQTGVTMTLVVLAMLENSTYG